MNYHLMRRIIVSLYSPRCERTMKAILGKSIQIHYEPNHIKTFLKWLKYTHLCILRNIVELKYKHPEH